MIFKNKKVLVCLAIMICLAGILLLSNRAVAQPTPSPLELTLTASIPAPHPTSTPPYTDIGDAYQRLGDPAKASDFYLKALELNPSDGSLLTRVQEAIRLQYDFLYQRMLKARDNLFSMADILVLVILWAVLLLILLGIVRLIRNANQDKAEQAAKKKRSFVVYPFDNGASGNMQGIEYSVQAMLAECLGTYGAYIEITHAKIDEALEAKAISLSDLDTNPIKLIDWLSKAVQPEPVQHVVDGTLLAPSVIQTSKGAQKAAGLQVRLRKTGKNSFSRTHTFWIEVPAGGVTASEYIVLAQQAAAWLFDNLKDPPSPQASRMLYSAMRMVVVGGKEPDVVREARRLFHESMALDQQTIASTKESFSAQGAGSAGGRQFDLENLSTSGSSLAEELSQMLENKG